MLNYGNYHGKCMIINTNSPRYNRQLYDYGVFIRPPKYKYLCFRGSPSIAARRQPLADASAAVFPSPLFLVASTTQPYGTPAPQDRPPPPPSLPARLPPCLSSPACVPACPPSAAVSLAWGVLDGAWGSVWGFLSWRGGLLGGLGDAHMALG